MTMEIESKLNSMSREELNLIAKRLGIPDYRRLKKPELISTLLNSKDREYLLRIMASSWWSRYHKHVYGCAGLLGLLATILFYVIPEFTPRDPAPSQNAIERERAKADSMNQYASDAGKGGLEDPNPIFASIPNGFLPLSMQNLIDEVANEELTTLQRNTLKSEYTGRLVQWLGGVQQVSPISNKPDSKLILLLSPVSSDKQFPEIISVFFSHEHRGTLKKLGFGDIVEFQATIRSFHNYNHLPNLDNGKIYRIIPKE